MRVFIDDVVIAASKQCDLSVRLSVQENSTKDDVDDWANQTLVSLSWELRANGVVTPDPDRNDPATLLDRIGQTVEVELALASGEKNSEKGDTLIAGTAIISDVRITAQNRENSVYEVLFTGQSNMLFPLAVLASSEPQRLVTSDGRTIVVDTNGD